MSYSLFSNTIGIESSPDSSSSPDPEVKSLPVSFSKSCSKYCSQCSYTQCYDFGKRNASQPQGKHTDKYKSVNFAYVSIPHNVLLLMFENFNGYFSVHMRSIFFLIFYKASLHRTWDHTDFPVDALSLRKS